MTRIATGAAEQCLADEEELMVAFLDDLKWCFGMPAQVVIVTGACLSWRRAVQMPAARRRLLSALWMWRRLAVCGGSTWWWWWWRRRRGGV